MALTVTCPACGHHLKVADKLAGRRGRCPQPGCGTVFRIPKEFEEEPVPEQRRSTRRTRGGSKPRKQKSRHTVVIAAAALLVVGGLGAWQFLGRTTSDSTVAQASEPPPKPDEFYPKAQPLLQKLCLDCHQGDEAEAGFDFSLAKSTAEVRKDRKVWERAHEMFEAGIMPPADTLQPTKEEHDQLLAVLDEALYAVDCTGGIDPGRVTVRRLNRAEYNNTIRDLLGVDFEPAADFPSDDVGYGFDNIGDVLSLPPLLMEKYLSAAEAIAAKSILALDPQRPIQTQFPADKLQLSKVSLPRDDGLVLISNGGFVARLDIVVGGKYKLICSAAGQQAGEEPARMEFKLDGQKLRDFDVKGKSLRYDEFEHEVTLTPGWHDWAVAFTNDFYDQEKKRDRNLLVKNVTLVGPLDFDPQTLPQGHRKLVAVKPAEFVTVAEAARNNLREFVTRAFRRPIRDDELTPFAKLAELAVSRGDSFEQAMQIALQGVLVSPQFLFRIETDKNPNDPADRHALNDYELASRLSYFLWSSLPDEELFAAAARGDLHTNGVLQQQVERMLQDPKSQALIDNFAEQWLQLRILDEITPDPETFPEFSPELRADMQEETRQFFGGVVREDRSVLDFLEGSFTFVNERLAKHYGLPDVAGNEFRRVSLEGTQRGGLLTQASILTLTSNPDRTSPVKRGKWIMEVILDTPPPPPPPNVPELAESAKANPDMSLRQQMELHRQNPACASCHRQMDALGFGLENFDAIGRWRDQDGKLPIDTAGELPDGSRFQGPLELAQILKGRRRQFCETLAERMLTYALGRGLEFYDRCTTDRIVQALERNDYRFSVLIQEIVRSEPFCMRRGEEQKP